MASGSSRGELKLIHRGVVPLQTIGYNAKGDGLNPRCRVLFLLAVGHDARENRNLCDPAAVILALEFDPIVHALTFDGFL